MPGRPASRPLKGKDGWVCLKFVYAGDAEPYAIAGGMRVLLGAMQPTVDAWLEAQANA